MAGARRRNARAQPPHPSSSPSWDPMQLDRSQEPSPQKHGEPRSLNEHRQPHRRRKKRKSFRRRPPTSRRPEQAPWLSHQATRNQSPLQGQAIFPLSHRRKKNHPRGAKDTRPHQLQQQPTGVGAEDPSSPPSSSCKQKRRRPSPNKQKNHQLFADARWHTSQNGRRSSPHRRRQRRHPPGGELSAFDPRRRRRRRRHRRRRSEGEHLTLTGDVQVAGGTYKH